MEDLLTRPLPTRVLVTGATGFVGRHMCAELLSAGVPVRSLVRGTGGEAPAGTEPAIVSGLDDVAGLERALAGVEGVVHLAAHVHQQGPRAANDPRFSVVNVEGTRRLMEIGIAAGVRDFVLASTVKVIGEGSTELWTEDTPAQPEDAYGASKLEAERLVRDLALRHGIHAPILRFPMVYGPGMKANILRLYRAVDRGIPLPLASIRNRRSFLFVGNLTAAVIATLRSEGGNETFFVTDGQDLSVPELISGIARALNRPARLLPVPAALLRALPSPAMRRLTGSLRADSSKLARLTGFHPPYSADAGLEMTAAWYRTYGRTA